MTVQQSGIVIRRYWDIPFPSDAEVTESAALEELDALLTETVRMHLVSDVPLGVFLSGGLDSSSLVAMMRRTNVEGVQTFSIGYDAPESELKMADIVAAHCRTDHNFLHLTPVLFRDRLPDAVWHMDEPVVDAPSIPLYCLAEFARKKVTVALSGEGADEIFGGYPTYSRMLLLDQLNRLPLLRLAGRLQSLLPFGKLRKNLSMLGMPLEARYRTSVVFSIEEVRRLLPDTTAHEDPYGELARIHARCTNRDSLSRMSYVDLQTWMPDDLLLKADRMTMAHGLELRVPFLDHVLVEFAARLPAKLKIRGTTQKYLLKRLVGPMLPPAVVHQSKRGFSMPTKAWFRSSLQGFVRETLLGDSPCLDYFPAKEIERILQSHTHRDRSSQIYALLVFDQWVRTFIRGRSARTAAIGGTLAAWLPSLTTFLFAAA
jgi:asparagine synthase (glutamine-hydrolysing)